MSNVPADSKERWALGVVVGLATLSLCAVRAEGVPGFFDLIPNGAMLQSNCSTCHDPVNGPPARNPFGMAFEQNVGWGPAVAQGDQDGDGRTSGEELGDPNGTWKSGDPDPPCLPPGCTNPGIADFTPPTSTPTPTLEPTSTRTHTPTSTFEPTSTRTRTATPTFTPNSGTSPTITPHCTGDCDGNHQVSIDELLRGIAIALGNLGLDDCQPFDQNQSHQVEINEVVAALRDALGACSGSSAGETDGRLN